MIDRLRSLFNSVEESDTAQQQREAMIDLLVWTMYVDNVLALPENDKLDQTIEGMPWAAVQPVQQYLTSAMARIRAILDDDAKAAALLDDLYQRLGDQETRNQAFEACCEIAQSDGQVADAETDFLKTLKVRFNIA